ncbi:MAG TPA: LacI family DNA-binding transcriptional regulator [Streptosporangiaceae bacterium]|nr:LacI family DNA-binding transcriptional regulator [Streptosporangiaceae bacterium]
MTGRQGPTGGQRAAPRRARIADVAADAGVGVGTVSRVLNGSPHVRAATRQRVLDAIERTSYRPSQLAAGLSRGTPRSVAILVPFLTRPSVVARLAGVIEVLGVEGYDTIVFNVETPAQRDHHARLLTERHRAAGVIVISLPLLREQRAALIAAGMPVVLVDVAAPGFPRTVVDDVRGGELATRHLLDLGHRRIAFVGDPRGGRPARDEFGFRSTADRIRGYRRALTAAGIPVDPTLIRSGPHSAAAAAELTRDLLRLPDPPTAIFANCDTQALGVLFAADAAGIPVPGGLSVIGFDDIETAVHLGLSTVRQPLRESGARGAARLCRLLRGETVTPLREELPLEVIARSSTGRPPPPRRGPSAGRQGAQGGPPTERIKEGITI